MMINFWATNTLCKAKADAQKPFVRPVSGTFNNISKDPRISLSKLSERKSSFIYREKIILYLGDWNAPPLPFSCCWIDYSWVLWWQIDRISWRSVAQLLPALSQILHRGRRLQRRHRQRTCPGAMAVLCLQRDPFNGRIENDIYEVRTHCGQWLNVGFCRSV